MAEENLAPTTSIETALVGRPLKVLALLSNVAGFILVMMSCASSHWMETSDYRSGLWAQCYTNATRFELMCWPIADNKTYIQVCAGLITSSVALAFTAILLLSLGMNVSHTKCKFRLYNVVLFVYFLVASLILAALLIYPYYFIQEMNEPLASNGPPYARWWYIGYAYATGWGSIFCLMASVIMLLADKHHDELIYREKVYMHSSVYSEAGGAGGD